MLAVSAVLRRAVVEKTTDAMLFSDECDVDDRSSLYPGAELRIGLS
jgi:hypothetical protein